MKPKGLHLCKKMLPIIKNAATIRYVSQRAVCSLTLLQESPPASCGYIGHIDSFSSARL
jgi:hypothetical protein